MPDEFYYAVLGPYLKYSSGFWKDENTTLAESEIYMLDMYIERAGVKDSDNLDVFPRPVTITILVHHRIWLSTTIKYDSVFCTMLR